MSHALTAQRTREFFDAPDVHRFKAIRELVLSSTNYDPSVSPLLAIEARLATDSPVQLLEECNQLARIYQICPRFHYVEARIRESLGEIQAMESAVHRLRACLRVIVGTGDGRKESPFLVTFITDEDDVVRSFGESVRYQQVLSVNGRKLDVVTAHSGIEFWFDATALIERSVVSRYELTRAHEIV